ncbi:JM100 [macacine gammaherpesvirus 11]|uniref:JM100 n=2 Tax=macacine gammaherpesvirus 11 TaxID=2560570 RepID=G9JMA8_9GAMA|nr:JM100 [Macaca fuscata rhadinovirus]AAT00077.1 JM100 [Macaca fuscata rhadinovirus]AEW87625.1 JM100 [Macaca fuscata rhadinovirus]AEW87795.1 JM100 [Macaca fuscata rhadinovirus]
MRLPVGADVCSRHEIIPPAATNSLSAQSAGYRLISLTSTPPHHLHRSCPCPDCPLNLVRSRPALLPGQAIDSSPLRDLPYGRNRRHEPLMFQLSRGKNNPRCRTQTRFRTRNAVLWRWVHGRDSATEPTDTGRFVHNL